MPRLDLDIERMRADILQKQHEAMKPFQEQLRNLDIIEQMVDQQATPESHHAEMQRLFKQGVEHEKPKPNGHHKPYAMVSQPTAILDILKHEPGLNAREIGDRMIAGGFPFKSKNPVSSVTQILRDMVKTQELVVKKPHSHAAGQTQTYTTGTGKKERKPGAVTWHPRRPLNRLSGE